MKRRLALAFALLLSLLLAALGWLGASESGLHWVYRQLPAQLPGELEVGQIGGRLIGPIMLDDVRYRDASGSYAADGLFFDWNPWALFAARLDIELIESSGLRVVPEPSPTAAAEPVAIPAIELPLEVSIHRLAIDQAQLVRAGQTTEIQHVEASLHLRRDRLEIGSLAIRAEPLRLTLGGSLRIGPELEHELDFDWQTTLPSTAALSGSGRLAGNLLQTRLRHRLDGAARADLSVELDAPLQQPRWRGDLNLETFDAALIDPSLPALQGSLRLSAAGDLHSAAANGELNLRQSPYGPLQTSFRLRRIELGEDAQGVTVSGLELDLFDGTVGTDGSFSWAPQIRWQARVATRALNPGAVRADWPGRIDAEIDIDGELQAGAPTVALEINSLRGELRGYPVGLRGAAQWRDNQASLTAIELTSGNSRVRLDGSIGEALDLDWSLHSGDLAELYPGAQGSVTAEGRLDGNLERAGIDAQLQGRALGYSGFSAAQLDASVALELDLAQASDIGFHRIQVDLDASDLDLRQRQLQRASLRTDGRQVAVEIEAVEGRASAELVGELEGTRWRGKLIEALLHNPEYGSWRLLAPAGLAAGPGAVELSGACLDNPDSGKICIDLDHLEDAGRLRFELSDVPLALSRPWLPTGVAAEGFANASGNLDYALPQRLHGDIEIDLPRGRVAYENTPGEAQVIEYERARMQTRIAEGGITARFDAVLGADESIEGSVELPGANLLAFEIDTQLVQAKLGARLHRLDPVDAALPQVERLRGSAEVDLEIGGRMSNPRVKGETRLRDASLYLPDLDLEIEQLELDARSDGLDRLDYRLQAQVAGGRLMADGYTTLDAAAGWPSRVNLDGKRLAISPLLQQRLPHDLVVDGRLDIGAKVELRLPDQASGTVELSLRDGSLYLPALGLQVERLQLDARSDGLDRLDYRLQARVAGGRVIADGQTTLGNEAGWASRVNLSGERLAISPLLQQRLPPDLVVDGLLGVDARIEFRLPDQVAGTVALRLPSGTVAYPLPNGETGSWAYREIAFDVELENRILDLRGGFSIGINRLWTELRLARFDPFNFVPQAQTLAGRIDIELDDLSLTESLLPDVQRTSGSLRARLELGGTLAQPQLRGSAEMRDGGLQIARLGLTLEQINFSANSDAEGLTHFNGGLRSGEGSIEFEGAIRLDSGAGWPGGLTIRGENFEVARIPEARVSISPQLEVRLANRIVDITGEVLLPYAKLQPRDITTAARVSADTVILGEEQDPGGRWQINSKVRLILGDRVSFFGYGFDGRLGGSLVIEESPGKPTRGSGEITILEGRYRAYGQYLDVEEGRLLYSGGPLTNPGLDVRAIRQTGDVIAGIKVSGRLSNPRVDLFSTPAMGQTDTLSYLLTGGPLDSASSGEGAMLANAALALGLSGGDRIARSIGDRFGFDEMRVESSSTGDQASLVVGRYLSPRLYVGYGVGLIESINTLNLRYRISERWQLEAESGEHQGADLFYGFER